MPAPRTKPDQIRQGIAIIRDPFRLDWLPVTKVEHYKVKPGAVRGPAAL